MFKKQRPIILALAVAAVAMVFAIVTQDPSLSVRPPAEHGAVEPQSPTGPSSVARLPASEPDVQPGASAMQFPSEHERHAGEVEGRVLFEDSGLVTRRLVLRNCRDEVWEAHTDEGMVNGVHRECDRVIEHEHAFSSLTDQQLRTLSPHDGAAALVLADRLLFNSNGENDPLEDKAQTREIRHLLILAFVLSNHQQAFDVMFDHVAGGGYVYADGILDTDHLAKNYVWSSIGERAGHTDPDDVAEYRDALLDAGMDLETLDARVNDWSARLDKDRRDITGEGLL